MIGESIDDAVDKYITKDFVSATIAEWAKTNFEINIDATDLKGNRQIDHSNNTSRTRQRPKRKRRSPPRSKNSWAKATPQAPIHGTPRAFQLGDEPVSRESAAEPDSQDEPEEVTEKLREAAIEQIENRDVNGLLKFLEPLYAEKELCAWAKEKFAIEVKPPS